MSDLNNENTRIAQSILEVSALLELKKKEEEINKRKFEQSHTQRRKKQVARKMIKSPKSMAKQSSVSKEKQNMDSSAEPETEEITFSPPIVLTEEQKKARFEAQHREQMKAFLLRNGFSGKQLGRMGIKTMEKHVKEYKLKDSLGSKDSEFVNDLEKALKYSQ